MKQRGFRGFVRDDALRNIPNTPSEVWRAVNAPTYGFDIQQHLGHGATLFGVIVPYMDGGINIAKNSGFIGIICLLEFP